jgi:hypothetical protein
VWLNPGITPCVKTYARDEGAELYAVLSSPDSVVDIFAFKLTKSRRNFRLKFQFRSFRTAWALNDVMHFGGQLSLLGNNGHARLKHADRFGANDPTRTWWPIAP